jgi:chemotaxis signal transduction protein
MLLVEAASLSPHVFAGSNSNQPVVFCLDEQRYALRPCAVEQIGRMAEITSLPKAPEIIPDDGLVFIHDLDTFLSLAEEKAMEQALTPA